MYGKKLCLQFAPFSPWNRSKQEYYISTTKTKRSNRIISIPKSLSELISQLIIFSKEKEFLFDSISMQTFSTMYRKFELKYNIEPSIRFHDLRHTHATILLAKGIDIKTISERLGHENI